MLWVFTSLAFAAAGRRVGPVAVNLLRILLAVVLLAVVHRLVFGSWVPRPDGRGFTLLAWSGVVGLALGDQLLFTALVDVGSRTATLLMTLVPPVAAILAWPMLDEPLGGRQVLGIAVTVGGIAWVVLERPAGRAVTPHRHRRRGVLFAALAAVCQAVGLILAKLGMGHTRLDAADHLDPWSATLVRMACAAVALTVITGIVRLIRGRRPVSASMSVSTEAEHLPGAGDGGRSPWPAALGLIAFGTLVGPVTGVWLSLVAIDLAEAGVAATLMAMAPVFILPFAVWIERERLGWRAIVGAMVAVAGVVVLTA
jgi:drug/metabolite transporter (DMT)-like permease